MLSVDTDEQVPGIDLNCESFDTAEDAARKVYDAVQRGHVEDIESLLSLNADIIHC